MRPLKKLLAIALVAVAVGFVAAAVVDTVNLWAADTRVVVHDHVIVSRGGVVQASVRLAPTDTSPIPPCWPPECTPCPCGPWCDCTVGLWVDLGEDENGVPRHGHVNAQGMSCPKDNGGGAR